MGATFTATVTGLPASAYMKAMPGVEGDIWLAGSDENNASLGGIYHSTNSGTGFNKLNSVSSAATIGFGMAATGSTYMALYTPATIGGVYGIYRSDDAGQTWIRINDDQHQYGTISCIKFASGAGSLAAGQSIEVQARVAKADWSNYTHTNDYSYNSTATTYTGWQYVTAYVSGTLVYGVEP